MSGCHTEFVRLENLAANRDQNRAILCKLNGPSMRGEAQNWVRFRRGLHHLQYTWDEGSVASFAVDVSMYEGGRRQ